ncbi:MAG: LppX_LprAFG lipoprotein [Aeromicrobium sp.]|uniref:LppX_LprAFG lipoprotein n=1 Tax=Aeromicrobium sp. TaxID=1871063 RepID=UPI0039E3DF1B
MSTRRLLPVLLLSLLALTACSGEEVDPEVAADRLESAATTLAEAERLDFSLTLDGTLPSDVDGLVSAEGFGNRTPAFEGTVRVQSGATLSADVVAVDGEVWAKLGVVPWTTIDPDDFGAPDPAALIGENGGGLVALLPEVEVAETSQERDGKTVLTAITGTVAGDLVAELIPSADPASDYEVTVRLTDDDAVHDVTLTGSFYPGADEDTTYVATVSASDESAEITAP